MRYKTKVLKRFPDAKLVVINRWPSGEPYHVAVYDKGSPLDICDDGDPQKHTAAWRSAYFWCVRHPAAEAA